MKKLNLAAIAVIILLSSATFMMPVHAAGEGPSSPIQIRFDTGGTFAGNLPNGTYNECWYNVTAWPNHWINATLYTSPGTAFAMELYGPGYRADPGHVGNFTKLADWAGSWSIRVSMDNSSSGTYTLAVAPTDQQPSTPSLSGASTGYVYTPINYTVLASDPENDLVSYEFNWTDGTTDTVTNLIMPNTPVTVSHQWIPPEVFYPQVRAIDSHSVSSSWSSAMQVTITQNDGGSYGDAGGNQATAAILPAGSYVGTTYSSTGTLYMQNALMNPPNDAADFYSFTVSAGDWIHATMTPPAGVGFNLQLYAPDGYRTGNTSNAGLTQIIDYTADGSGSWCIAVLRATPTSGQGQYSFTLLTTPNHATLTIYVPSAPSYAEAQQLGEDGATIMIDGVAHMAYSDIPVVVTLPKGQHTVFACSFERQQWMPGYWYIYTFTRWSDGSTSNPRTINLTSDTSLTAQYVRSKYAIL